VGGHERARIRDRPPADTHAAGGDERGRVVELGALGSQPLQDRYELLTSRHARKLRTTGEARKGRATMSRMAFAAQPHENILFPVPYAENEEHPIIITNQRIVQRNMGGTVEMPTKDVHTVGRHVVRPRLPAGLMLLTLALPLLGFGIYQFYSVWDMTAASPLSLVGVHDDAPAEATPDAVSQAPEGEDPLQWPRTVLLTRIAGIALLAAALGCAIGARRLIRKKRYYVVCRGTKRLVKIEAKDEIQQTQIMVTVSAVKGKAPPPK
jgi:hypothetical protein